MIFHVLTSGLFVILGAKASEPFIAEIHRNRIQSCKYYIDSEIEFLPFKQQWVDQVPLNNDLFAQ